MDKRELDQWSWLYLSVLLLYPFPASPLEEMCVDERETYREAERELGSWFDEGCKENVNQTITLRVIDWDGREVISTEKKGKLRPLLMFWYKVFFHCTHFPVVLHVCMKGDVLPLILLYIFIFCTV